MEIRVTPDSLRTNATTIRTYKSEYEQTINSITALVNSLNNEFTGAAATAFMSNYESYKSTFTQFSELIESFAQKLDTTATTMEEADQTLANNNAQ